MLIMKRRAGESIVIGDTIEIHISEIGRTKVKIAIQAPREIAVTAKEVTLARQENRVAAAAQCDSLRELAARFSMNAQEAPKKNFKPASGRADEELGSDLPGSE